MSCENCKVDKLDLKKCTRCWDVYYCSKDCQRQHWKRHKHLCDLIKKQNSLDKHETDPSYQTTGNVMSHIENIATDEAMLGDTESEVTLETDMTANGAIDMKDQHKDTGVKVDSNKVTNECGSKQAHLECAACQTVGDLKTGAQCKDVSYCSKACQKKDWRTHKTSCNKINITINKQQNVLSSRYVLDEEERLKKIAKADEEEKEKKINYIHFNNKPRGYVERFKQMLSPEKANATAIRPPGSLDSAKVAASKLYPDAVITDDINDIPHENLRSMLSHKVAKILVAFIFKYHGDVIRHGVYLQDKDDAVTRVEFYLDHVNDDPRPHFTYDDVKPGNYICLKNPYNHNFDNGTIGIRMDDPSEVKVIQV